MCARQQVQQRAQRTLLAIARQALATSNALNISLNELFDATQRPSELIEEHRTDEPLVGGGGDKIKVNRRTVDSYAVQLICEDIAGKDSTITGKFLDHLIKSDKRAARAVTHGQDAAQRLQAVAAACLRAGLPERAQLFQSLVESVKTGKPSPYGTSGSTPQRSDGTNAGQTMRPPETSVIDRLAALEEWTNQFGISTYLDAALGHSGQQTKVDEIAARLETVSAHLIDLEGKVSHFAPTSSSSSPPPPPLASTASSHTHLVLQRVVAIEGWVRFLAQSKAQAEHHIATRLSSLQAQFEQLSVQVQMLQQRSQALTSRMLQDEFGADRPPMWPGSSNVNAPTHETAQETPDQEATSLRAAPRDGAQAWQDSTLLPNTNEAPDAPAADSVPVDPENIPWLLRTDPPLEGVRQQQELVASDPYLVEQAAVVSVPDSESDGQGDEQRFFEIEEGTTAPSS
eukprot:6458763-Amphidinium_carterae.1